MKCPVCKQGETEPGKATVTLERDSLTLVVKGVPARVCRNCGEEYIDDSIPQDEEAEEMGEGGWADKVYPPNREDED